MNVFSVVISENCRKQPRKMLDFVVQTESNIGDVQQHYNNCYSGFHVQVYTANVLSLTVEKPEVQQPATTKQNVVKSLTIENPPLTEDEKTDLNEFVKARNRASDLSSQLRGKIEKRLKTKYNDICHDNVTATLNVFKEWPRYSDDYKITVTIAFRGSIVEHIANEIANNK